MEYINIEKIKEDIIQFCKPKKGKYRDRGNVIEYINAKLGIIDNNIIIIKNNKRVNYFNPDVYLGFDENIVWLSLPLDGVCIHCSINWALSLPVAKDILEGKFKEKSFTINYYNYTFKTIMKSPIIIIMSVPIESIILEDGISLKEFISDIY